MKATWDIETARTCKIDTIAPEKCEQCRDNKYCFKQMTLFDLFCSDCGSDNRKRSEAE